jgi:hypothetical protein
MKYNIMTAASAAGPVEVSGNWRSRCWQLENVISALSLEMRFLGRYQPCCLHDGDNDDQAGLPSYEGILADCTFRSQLALCSRRLAH